MPKKPLKYMAVGFGRRLTELDRIRLTDACVDDSVRLLKEAAALSSSAFASELMARTKR
jgi:hypothetical protein